MGHQHPKRQKEKRALVHGYLGPRARKRASWELCAPHTPNPDRAASALCPAGVGPRAQDRYCVFPGTSAAIRRWLGSGSREPAGNRCPVESPAEVNARGCRGAADAHGFADFLSSLKGGPFPSCLQEQRQVNRKVLSHNNVPIRHKT